MRDCPSPVVRHAPSGESLGEYSSFSRCVRDSVTIVVCHAPIAETFCEDAGKRGGMRNSTSGNVSQIPKVKIVGKNAVYGRFIGHSSAEADRITLPDKY
jgi:hypothetical protein